MRVSNKLWRGVLFALPLSLILWALIIGTAKATIGGGYIWMHDYVQVKVGQWEPHYIYPVMPPWQICPVVVKPEECHEKYYRVGDDITITWERDGEMAHIYHRNQTDPEFSRYDGQWMLVFVSPGYVGVTPSNNIWIAKNQRTGFSWAVYELDQVEDIAPPMAPTGLK